MKQLTTLILLLLFGLNVSSSEYPKFSMFGELPACAFYVRHVEGLTMKNISVRAKARNYRPAFVFDDVKNLKLDQLRITEEDQGVQVILMNVENTDLKMDQKLLKKIN
ncbi:MAG: hypothetical protein JNK09_08770 [Prolixibacteraceae bacterium]|nr:hypothetical protein [Prolixibacteraceae bacterium]